MEGEQIHPCGDSIMTELWRQKKTALWRKNNNSIMEGEQIHPCGDSITTELWRQKKTALWRQSTERST